jgi:hypothetical protein
LLKMGMTARLPDDREVSLMWSGRQWMMKFRTGDRTTELALTPEAMGVLVELRRYIMDQFCEEINDDTNHGI